MQTTVCVAKYVESVWQNTSSIIPTLTPEWSIVNSESARQMTNIENYNAKLMRELIKKDRIGNLNTTDAVLYLEITWT